MKAPLPENKIFIGGLPEKTTKQNIINYFSTYGKVTSCIIMYDKDRKSRGFGFIIFEESSAMNDVLRLHNHKLQGKLIECKSCVPKETQTKQLNEDLSYENRIFIGGVGELSDKIVYNYFSQYGEIENLLLIKDKITQKSRGFGYVSFKEDRKDRRIVEVIEMIVNKEHVIENHVVECKKSYQKKVNQSKKEKEIENEIEHRKTMTISMSMNMNMLINNASPSPNSIIIQRKSIDDKKNQGFKYGLSDYFNYKMNDSYSLSIDEEFRSFFEEFNKKDFKNNEENEENEHNIHYILNKNKKYVREVCLGR